MYQNHALYFKRSSSVLIIIALLSMMVLTTSTAFASGSYDHLEACSLIESSGFRSVSSFADLGAEIDARLAAEFDSARCVAAELEAEFDLVLDQVLSQELGLEAAQGLEQDIRLAEELSAAREAMMGLSLRQPSVDQIARQIAAQEAREAGLVSELAAAFAQGAAQDLRFAQELALALDAVEELSTSPRQGYYDHILGTYVPPDPAPHRGYYDPMRGTYVPPNGEPRESLD